MRGAGAARKHPHFKYKHNRKTPIMQNAPLPNIGGYCIIKTERSAGASQEVKAYG